MTTEEGADRRTFVKTGPALIRALARALVRLFYHRVEIVGADRVARSGPLVVVANHRNALVDPLILIATMPRILRPVAKSTLFRHPILAPFLRLAGALPVHRRQDPGSDPTQNAAMFRAVAASPSVPRTIRATPVRSGISTGSGWLTPSGKIRIASPARSAGAGGGLPRDGGPRA